MPYRDYDPTPAEKTAIPSKPESEVEASPRRAAPGNLWAGLGGAAGDPGDALHSRTNGRLSRAGIDLLQLQNQYGNQYVQRLINPQQPLLNLANRGGYQGISSGSPKRGVPLLQTKLTVGAVGDKYEQEADHVAAQVVQTFSSPTDNQPVQRQAGEDDLQTKPDQVAVQRCMTQPHISNLQRKSLNVQQQPAAESNLVLRMHNTLQRQVGVEGGTVSGDIESSIQRARGNGKPLDSSVRASMEQAFGTDFSNVKVHTNSIADSLNRSLNARAFTTGSDLFFRKGEYNPSSSGGQKLLAHELTHVVQQGGAGIQKKTLRKTPIKIRQKAQPTIQRLITGEELQKVDPLHLGSKTYKKILVALNEYAVLTQYTNIVELTKGWNTNYNKIVGLLDYIKRLAVPKKESRPILGILTDDIINEQDRIEDIYNHPEMFVKRDKDGVVESDIKKYTLFNELRKHSRSESDYKQIAKEYDLKSGGLKSLKKFLTGIQGAKFNSLSAIGLVLEGIGHLASGVLAVSLGVGAVAANIMTAIGFLSAALGNIFVGLLKFIRAFLLKWKDRLAKKLGNAHTKVAKIGKLLANIVSLEGAIKLIADLIAIILIPQPWNFSKIGSLVKQFIKFIRGFILKVKVKKEKESAKKGLTSFLTIVEAAFGLVDNVEVAPPPEFEDNFADPKSTTRWLGDIGSGIKTARGTVGGIGAVKTEVEALASEKEKALEKYKADYQDNYDWENELP